MEYRRAKVRMQEHESYWVVSGDYNDVKNVIPLLKKQRVWKYDPTARVWRADRLKVTPKQLAEVRVMIEGPQGVVGGVSSEVYEDLVKEGMGIELSGGYSFTRQGGNLVLTVPSGGGVTDVEIQLAGGVRGSAYWVFNETTLEEKAFRKLLKKLKDFSEDFSDKLGKVLRVIPKGRVEWKLLKVVLTVSGNNVIFSGQTFNHKDLAKAARMGWNGTKWGASILDVGLEGLKVMVSSLTEEEEAKAKDVVPVVGAPAPVEQKRRTNSKVGVCRKCGGVVEVGVGYLYEVFDDDDEKFVYEVEHKERSECEAHREVLRGRAEKARGRAEKARLLRDLSVRRENYVEGMEYPRGKSIQIDANYTVVVEPGGREFWYIMDNGKDGDDWSRNNLPGAIGYRLELTEEIRGLINGIKGEGTI